MGTNNLKILLTNNLKTNIMNDSINTSHILGAIKDAPTDKILNSTENIVNHILEYPELTQNEILFNVINVIVEKRKFTLKDMNQDMAKKEEALKYLLAKFVSN